MKRREIKRTMEKEKENNGKRERKRERERERERERTESGLTADMSVEYPKSAIFTFPLSKCIKQFSGFKSR